MARAAGLGYGELFSFAYPDRFDPRTASPAAQTILSMLEGLHPSKSRLSSSPSAFAGFPADLETVVRRVMQEIRRQQPKKGDGPKAGNGSSEP